MEIEPCERVVFVFALIVLFPLIAAVCALLIIINTVVGFFNVVYQMGKPLLKGIYYLLIYDNSKDDE